jgi:putative PEP-CTERM system TPR-repeat lipoprotein
MTGNIQKRLNKNMKHLKIKTALLLMANLHFSANAQAATAFLDKNELFQLKNNMANEGTDNSLSQYYQKNQFGFLSDSFTGDSRFIEVSEYFKKGELDKAINFLLNLKKDLKKDQKNDQKINQLLVMAYLKGNKFDDARKIITESLKTTPKKPNLYNQLALLEILQSANKDEAIKNFNKAIELDPKNIEAYTGLAKIAVNENKFPEAEGYTKKILDIDNKNISAYLDLAFLADKQGKKLEAENYLNIAHQKTEGHFKAEMEISAIQQQWYAKQNKIKNIVELAENLVSKYPFEIQPLDLLAIAQVANGKIDSAEAAWRKIINSDPTDFQFRFKLANFLAKQPNRQNDAIKLLDEAEAIKPDIQEIYQLKAALYNKQKQFDLAQKTADKARQLFPQSPLADQIQGDVLYNQAQFGKSLEAYLKAYNTKPSNLLLFFITNLMAQHGQQQQAIDLINNEIKKTDRAEPLHFELATIYLNMGKTSQAREHYLAVVEKDSKNVLALNNLAYVYATEQSPEALVYAKKAYDLAPKEPNILDTYGNLLVNQGDWKQGLPLLEQAGKLLPDNDEVKFHLAKAYLLKGDKALASKLLNKIVNSKQDFPYKAEIADLIKKAK